MQYLKIAILIFMSHAAFAKAFDFKAYNQLANKAELAITANNYSLALDYFNAAFEIKEKPFVQDIYNASICAIKENKLHEAAKLCRRLANAGVGGQFLSGNSIYQPLTTLKEWEELIRLANERRAQFQSVNKDLLHVLDSMSEKDQSVNHEWREAGFGMETPERKRMDLTYDTLSSDLFRLFNKTGFISEQMIGAVVKNDTTLEYRLPYDIIVIHNYQSRRQGDTLFRSMLYKAMYDGLVKPEYLALIEDFGSNMIERPNYGTTHCYVLYKCNMYLDQYAKEIFSTLNANRESIGMGPVDDDLKKILYKINNPHSKFMLRANYSKYGSFANKDSEDKFLSTSELVVREIPECQ